MPPSSRSSATSLERTRNVLESSAQNSEGVACIRGGQSCVEFSAAVAAVAAELSCPELGFIPCIRLRNLIFGTEFHAQLRKRDEASCRGTVGPRAKFSP
jgi:hypothetical protein